MGCLAVWLICWLVGWLVGWFVGSLVGWLAGWWLAGWLVGRLVGWLVDWLVGWLVGRSVGLLLLWLFLLFCLLTDSDKRQKQYWTQHTWVILRVCTHTNSSSFIHAASQLTFSLSSLRVACVGVCLQNCSLHSDSAESPGLAPSSGFHEWSVSRLLTPPPPLCLSFVSLSVLCHSILWETFFITDMMLTVITEGH